MKQIIKQFLLLMGLLLTAIGLQAQTYVTAPLTTTLPPGQYYNNSVLSLGPGISLSHPAVQTSA